MTVHRIFAHSQPQDDSDPRWACRSRRRSGGCSNWQINIVPLRDTEQNTSLTRIRHSTAPSTDTDSTQFFDHHRKMVPVPRPGFVREPRLRLEITRSRNIIRLFFRLRGPQARQVWNSPGAPGTSRFAHVRVTAQSKSFNGCSRRTFSHKSPHPHLLLLGPPPRHSSPWTPFQSRLSNP